jgi:uncharacterized protein YbjT (DUF2867 family)
MNDQLGGLLTWKLAGEDLVRASGVPHAIVRPTALTEEPARMPVEIGQGDTVSVRCTLAAGLTIAVSRACRS